MGTDQMVVLGWSWGGLQGLGLAVAIVALVVALLKMGLSQLQSYLLRHAESTEGKRHDKLFRLLADMAASVSIVSILAVGVYAAMKILVLPERVDRMMDKLAIILVLLQVGLWGNRIIAHYLNSWMEVRCEKDPSQQALLGLINYFARVLFWLLLVLIALNNLGVDITALVAGVGIGGIAIALAVQSILGDALGSLTIALDKPFAVGETIQVDDLIGTIEHVGLKTTRIRALTGEQVILANSDLLKLRIRNRSRMNKRRVVVALDIPYSTPSETLRGLPELLRETVLSVPLTEFEAAFMKAMGPYSLQFEVIYYVTNPDFLVYQSTHHELMVRTLEVLKVQGVEIPFPTQTIQLPGRI